MATKKGKIIKGIGGFYYVETDQGLVECKARGKFRKDDITPIVGDNVEVNIDDDGKGYVLSILKRTNSFIRPPIANIDKLLIVSSVVTPSPDPLFIDKMLVIAESASVKAALCFNKSDLNNDTQSIIQTYRNAGYDVFVTSTKNDTGLDDVKQYMTGSVMAVCGFSGVGKSSILNKLTNTTGFAVGEISEKLSRGKHTTRHVELIKVSANTYLADTPGFSSLSLSDSIDCQSLINYFPDLASHTSKCKFSDCSHTNQKHCGVYDALVSGKISGFRYENYKLLYNTLKDNKEWKK